MTLAKLAMSWAAADERTYCLPTSLLLTVALGEAPETIPSLIDVRHGQVPAASKFDGGPLDRIIGRYAGALRVARVHSAKASWHLPGRRHIHFNALEQITGLARSFMIEVPLGTPIATLVQALSQVSKITSVSPNYVSAIPFDRLATRRFNSASATGLQIDGDQNWAAQLMIRAPEALAREPGDSAVLLGLIDSGIVTDHPELAGRLRTGWDTVDLSSNGVAPGIKLLGEHKHHDNSPLDHFVGHGMACAGIMSGLGLQLAPGLAGDAQIIPMRALAAAQLPGRANPVGLGSIADLDAALKLSVDLGAKVINMSFGTDDSALAPESPKPHADVVRYAQDHGCILVAASGNNGQWTRYWPAAHDDVIAVGAASDDFQPTSFSTRGEHVSLCAPGERILSTGLSGYQYVTGTSFAAPFVAAACALLVARSARRAMPLESKIAKQILIDSCQAFSNNAGKSVSGCGAGILDAAAALVTLDALIDKMREGESAEDG